MRKEIHSNMRNAISICYIFIREFRYLSWQTKIYDLMQKQVNDDHLSGKFNDYQCIFFSILLLLNESLMYSDFPLCFYTFNSF